MTVSRTFSTVIPPMTMVASEGIVAVPRTVFRSRGGGEPLVPEAAVKLESSIKYSIRRNPPSEIDGVTRSVVPASAKPPKPTRLLPPVLAWETSEYGCSERETISDSWLSLTRSWGVERILISLLVWLALIISGIWLVMMTAAVRPPSPGLTARGSPKTPPVGTPESVFPVLSPNCPALIWDSKAKAKFSVSEIETIMA